MIGALASVAVGTGMTHALTAVSRTVESRNIGGDHCCYGGMTAMYGNNAGCVSHNSG